MRRFCWALAILLIGLLMVAGCGKKQQTSSQPGVTKSGPQAKTEAPAAEKPAKPSTPFGELTAARMGLKTYRVSVEMGGQKLVQYMKLEGGKPVRVKSEMGAQGWALMEFDNEVQYMFDPKSKTVMKMTMKVPKDSTPDPSGIPGIKGGKIPKMVAGKLDGQDCWITETSVENSGPIKAWIDKEYGLARQVSMGGKTMKFEYAQINSVPDSQFELPAGAKVQEMPAMPQGAPKGAPGP